MTTWRDDQLDGLVTVIWDAARGGCGSHDGCRALVRKHQRDAARRWLAAHPAPEAPEATVVEEPRLHPSHRWGQRPYYVRTEPGSNVFREQKIPCCLNCLVDGFEDERDAFAECRRQDNPVGGVEVETTTATTTEGDPS